MHSCNARLVLRNDTMNFLRMDLEKRSIDYRVFCSDNHVIIWMAGGPLVESWHGAVRGLSAAHDGNTPVSAEQSEGDAPANRTPLNHFYT